MRIKHCSLIFAFLAIFLGIPLMQGCNDPLDEHRKKVPDTVLDDEWGNVSLTIEGMKLNSLKTRSLTQAGENEIGEDNIRVFVFDKDGKFSYEALVVAFTATNEKKDQGTMTLFAKNTPNGNTSTFVMLANVSSEIEAEELEGKTREEVLELFTFNMPAEGVWNDGELPMWGTSAAISVNHSSGAVPKLGTIYLIRAVVRVDVGLKLSNTAEGASLFNEKAEGLDGIKLTNIYFYNTNAKGRVAPFEDEATWDASGRKAKQPSLPVPAPTVINKIDKTSAIVDDKIVLRDIYVPEATNTPVEATQGANGEMLPEDDTENYLKRPYIIVGLVGADKDQPEKKTFFRIDYLKRTGSEASATYEYLPLLRNYRYLVNINNVNGPGFDKEEDAQKGPAANIMYDVVVWNESTMSNVQYDGQYMLGVSDDDFTFYREGGSLTAKVQTSWPEGFTVENLPDWIDFTIAPAELNKTGNTDEKIVTFTISNGVDADRTWPEQPEDAENPEKAAYIKAGRMKWFLNFKQSKEMNVTLQIFADESCTQPLEFIEINQYGENYGQPDKVIIMNGQTLTAEEAGAKVTFYVKTEPQNLEPEFHSNAVNRFKIVKEAQLTGGVWKYTVTAPDITENSEFFDNFNTTYTFSITYTGTGDSASGKLSLLQKEYNAIPFYSSRLGHSLLEENQGVYVMDGREKEFFVKANSEYKIELISARADNGLGDVIEPFLPFYEQNPSLSGTPVSFTAVDDLTTPRLFSGQVKFRIYSPNGLFPEREFYLKMVSGIVQPEANTYMIKKGSKQGILIPVSRVNTAYNYYKMLLEHDANLTGNSDKFLLPGKKEEFMLNRLADDDDWTVNIVWTDIHLAGNNPVERAGLKRLQELGGSGPNSYIYVEGGDNAGNVLIEIRSGKLERKETLWSWHIWIVDEYPTVETINKTGGNGAAQVKLMSHLLGAYKEVQSNYNVEVYQEFGMQYQWGRKDPFPSYGVYENVPFYNGNGDRFDFIKNQKGDRANFGIENALSAAGGTLTMKSSIENPNTLVSHQSFWQFELFPHANVGYFENRWVFLYPWNQPVDNGNDPKAIGGKTVFDPSPYGFRIMSQDEAVTLRYAYYNGPAQVNGLATPTPGYLYDGSLTFNGTGGKNCIFAVSQGRQGVHAGCYLLNSLGTKAGWSSASNSDATFRRAMTFSVRPVIDPDVTEDYTEYLPK